MRPKINFITLAVTDLKRSVNFYKDAFHFPLGEQNDELCMFELADDFSLVLQRSLDFVVQSGNSFTASSGFILSRSVKSSAELNEIVDRAVAHGAIKVKTLDEDWGYSVTIKDFDGHVWEIVRLK
ncbi:MAG: hypothetical protein EOO47_12995 [Flavobacterium sp.]|nr:MAG: hypothetical protein EOO47_12995 [Flavobacterium sp.]